MNSCVSLQGGYAAYRYAQPAGTAAPAYSDRYDAFFSIPETFLKNFLSEKNTGAIILSYFQLCLVCLHVIIDESYSPVKKHFQGILCSPTQKLSTPCFNSFCMTLSLSYIVVEELLFTHLYTALISSHHSVPINLRSGLQAIKTP